MNVIKISLLISIITYSVFILIHKETQAQSNDPYEEILLRWRTENAFPDWGFATDIDTPYVKEVSTINGVRLRYYDEDKKNFSCQFPLQYFFKGEFRSHWGPGLPFFYKSQALLNEQLKKYYMRVERVGLPASGKVASSNVLYTDIVARGPEIDGFISCSQAVLLTLGINPLDWRDIKKNDIDKISKLNVRLVKRTPELDRIKRAQIPVVVPDLIPN